MQEKGYEQDQEEYEEQMQGTRPDIRIIQEMIYDKSIPKGLQTKMWGLISKSQVLSNITDRDERIQLREFNIAVREVFAAMVASDVTSDFRTDITNLRSLFRANLTRAKGENRERVLQQKQVVESISNISGRHGANPEDNRGFFGSVFGKLFGKKKKAVAVVGKE